jgi:hypothetical protein
MRVNVNAIRKPADDEGLVLYKIFYEVFNTLSPIRRGLPGAHDGHSLWIFKVHFSFGVQQGWGIVYLPQARGKTFIDKKDEINVFFLRFPEFFLRQPKRFTLCDRFCRYHADAGDLQEFALRDLKDPFGCATVAHQLSDQKISDSGNKVKGEQGEAVLIHAEGSFYEYWQSRYLSGDNSNPALGMAHATMRSSPDDCEPSFRVPR